MKLSIKDRLLLINLLPQKGNFVTMTIREDLFNKIKISQEEIEVTEMHSTDAGVTWNTDKEGEERLFEFSELEIEMVKNILKSLDEKKELTADTIDLYKLFI